MLLAGWEWEFSCGEFLWSLSHSCSETFSVLELEMKLSLFEILIFLSGSLY